jgi:hypothetical protein
MIVRKTLYKSHVLFKVMPIEGFRDYVRREYCNGIKCSVQLMLNSAPKNSEKHEKIRETCKSSCVHTTYEFHHWLMDNDFLIVKPDNSDKFSGG